MEMRYTNVYSENIDMPIKFYEIKKMPVFSQLF